MAAEKLKPPEGVCYKQRPTIRTWPARYVRIEGKQSTFLLVLEVVFDRVLVLAGSAFNVYDKDEWEKYAAAGGENAGAPPPEPRGSSIVDCSVLEKVTKAQKPEIIAKVAKAKLILEGEGLLGGGTATYCFDTEGTRDRFALALENMAEGREWHEDAMATSRARLTSGVLPLKVAVLQNRWLTGSGAAAAGGGAAAGGRGSVAGGAPMDMSHVSTEPIRCCLCFL